MRIGEASLFEHARNVDINPVTMTRQCARTGCVQGVYSRVHLPGWYRVLYTREGGIYLSAQRPLPYKP